MSKKHVPLHLQDDGSDDCGPISCLMTLDHFGITDSRKDVLAKVPRSFFGTATFDLAQTLKDYGLHPQVITAHPQLFNGDFRRSNPGKPEVLAKLTEVHDQEKSADKQGIVQSFINYISNEGDYQVAIPSEEILKKALSDDKVVIISMYGRALGAKEGGYHFVVVDDYKDGRFHIANPWPHSRRQSWEQAEDVLFAIHCSTLFDYDNGAVLIVGR